MLLLINSELPLHRAPTARGIEGRVGAGTADTIIFTCHAIRDAGANRRETISQPGVGEAEPGSGPDETVG